MKLYVLDCGSLYIDEGVLVAGIHGATKQNPNPPAQYVEIPVPSYLVETKDGYVLYDTAFHAPREGGGNLTSYTFKPEQLLPELLKSLHVDPGDVKYVIQSHLHSDHVGYLYLFTNAEIFVSDNEFTQAMRLYGLHRMPGPHVYADFDDFIKAKLNWNLIPAEVREVKICEGVTAVHFGPGHSFGVTGMLVELPESGNFLMCSDALYREENFGPPVRLPILIYDSINFIKTAEFIRQYAKEHDAKILFGHDMKQFSTLTKSTDGYYK
ncbi:MAG: N-acyl homoserine lactonase family protein [Peptococcaceae bacterium]|nr:N-acyl homoserine lactonase family protein [Peptococcaceae bacterium]